MLTKDQRIFLASSAEFQKLVADDPVCAELEAQKTDREAEALDVTEMLGSITYLCGIPVQPVTPAVWAYLWTAGNAFTLPGQTIRKTDIDSFFWLLSTGLRAVTARPQDLAEVSANFCLKHEIAYSEAASAILKLIERSFRPLRMIPASSGGNDGPVEFDAAWLASVASCVARMTNQTASDVMFNMPLSAAFHYQVEKLRESDTKNAIRKYSPGELAQRIVERVEYLGQEFCKRRNKCQPQEK